MQKLVLSLAACLLAVATTGASAQAIWKWRDSSGQMHMSDTAPPPDTPQKNILQRPNGAPMAAQAPAPDAAPAVPPAGGDSDLQKKKLKADQERAEKTAADKASTDQKNAAIRAENCSRAQTQQKALDSGVRIARLNAAGEREFLDDAARAAETKRSQEIIAQNCGAAAN